MNALQSNNLPDDILPMSALQLDDLPVDIQPMNALQSNNLPDDILPIIFRYLDIANLLNCRLVSVTWRYFIDKIKITNLVLTNLREMAYNKRFSWFLTNEQINYKNSYPNDELFFYKAPLVKNMLDSLKCLNYCKKFPYSDDYNIGYLNRFASTLEQLNVGTVELRSTTIQLNLPNLIIFSICRIDGRYDCRLVVDAPKLRYVFCSDLIKQFVLVHHESVQHLEMNHYPYDLASFINLELLQINRWPELATYKRSLVELVTSLPKLKELFINSRVTMTYKDDYNVGKDYLKELFGEILNQRRHDLNIYLNGVLLKNSADIFTYKQQVNLEKWQIQNYQQLASNLSWFYSVDYLNYSNLIDSIHKLPDDYFQRFMNIQMVKCSQLKDEEQFLAFLNKCKKLRELSISGSVLSRQFYNSLCTLNLISLEIGNFSARNSTEIDFSFLFNLPLLGSFSTYHQLPVQLGMQLFESNNQLFRIEFTNCLNRFKITKGDLDSFTLSFLRNFFSLGAPNERIDKNNLSYKELVELCNSMASTPERI